jgi:hypothetical protein
MEPFSDNASILFGEAAKISRPFKWKHLKAYLDIPEFKQLNEKAKPILVALNGIVYYSQQVVVINNSRLPEKQKNNQLANYLSNAMQIAGDKGQLEKIGLDEQALESVFRNIRQVETYLEAIREASPVINSIVLSLQNSMDDLQKDIVVLLAALDSKIETDFADKRTNFMELKALQTETMAALTYVYRMQMGQQQDLEKLLKMDQSLSKFFASSREINTSQLEAAETFLLKRLDDIDTVLKQLSADVADYYAKQDEMEAWRINTDERIRVARNAITVWAQSHRNLGSGVPVPPMIDVAGIASGLSGSAAGVVLP